MVLLAGEVVSLQSASSRTQGLAAVKGLVPVFSRSNALCIPASLERVISQTSEGDCFFFFHPPRFDSFSGLLMLCVPRLSW